MTKNKNSYYQDRGDRRSLSRNERYPERIPRLTSDEDHSQRHQPSTSTHMTPLDPPVSSRRTSPLPTSSSGPPNPYPSDCGIVVRRGLSRGRIGQKESASGLQNQDEGMNIVATRPSSNFNKEGNVLLLIKVEVLRNHTNNFSIEFDFLISVW